MPVDITGILVNFSVGSGVFDVGIPTPSFGALRKAQLDLNIEGLPNVGKLLEERGWGYETRTDLPLGLDIDYRDFTKFSMPRISTLDAEIAWAQETGVFGTFIGPPAPLFQERQESKGVMPVVVRTPLPPPPVMRCP